MIEEKYRTMEYQLAPGPMRDAITRMMAGAGGSTQPLPAEIRQTWGAAAVIGVVAVAAIYFLRAK